MSLKKYYIDGSSLSLECRVKVDNLVINTAFTHNVIPGKICAYEAFWNEAINPALDIHFPSGCVIEQIN